MNTLPAPSEKPPTALDPSALSGARLLMAKRMDELTEASRRLESRLSETGKRRAEIREHLQDAEIAWGHIANNLSRFGPPDIEAAFKEVSELRATIAASEERFRDIGARLADVRAEQDTLTEIDKSLDSIASDRSDEGTAQLRNASRQVFQLIEDERMRIARDMHDGPAQSMANLVLQAEILERLIGRDPELVIKELADFKQCVRAILDETRRLIFDLRPMTLDDLGLVPTLRKFVKEYGEKNHITTHLRIVGEERRLPGNYEPTLFRIIQEAMTNVRKHAQAKTVELTITFQPKRVIAGIKDDGCGFDINEADERQTKSLGLTSMRERTGLEKGSLQVRSQPGRGTEVRVAFDI